MLLAAFHSIQYEWHYYMQLKVNINVTRPKPKPKPKLMHIKRKHYLTYSIDIFQICIFIFAYQQSELSFYFDRYKCGWE